jgi:hypothetical protein
METVSERVLDHRRDRAPDTCSPTWSASHALDPRGKAILRGTVRSFAEIRDAERATRNARGVTEVESRLTADPGVYATV